VLSRLEAKVRRGGHVPEVQIDPRSRLRIARARHLDEFANGPEEFVVLVARREADGSVALIGAVEADQAFTEKALRQAII
jgi:hypothetical protein